MQLQPYLFFEGHCDEAAEFYRNALGAEVVARMQYKEAPESSDDGGCQPGDAEKVMHMSLRIGDALFMASDGRCSGKPNFEGFSLSLAASDEAEADRWFTALAERGEVRMPLGPTFFSPRFGMVVDQFGVSWMILVAPRESSAAVSDGTQASPVEAG